MKTNAVEVALHRALNKLRTELADAPVAPPRLQPRAVSAD